MIAGFNVKQARRYLDVIAKFAYVPLHEISDRHLARKSRKSTLITLVVLRRLSVGYLERLDVREGRYKLARDAISEPAVVACWREIIEWQDHEAFSRLCVLSSLARDTEGRERLCDSAVLGICDSLDTREMI